MHVNPQRRATPFVLLTLFSLLLAAGAASAASISITSGGSKAGTYPMTVEVGDFRLAPVSATPANRAGEGHIHYLINGQPAPGDYATNAKSFTFNNLKNGDEVGAELVNNDHSALSPKTIATSKVGAGVPGFEPLVLLGALAVAISLVRRRGA